MANRLQPSRRLKRRHLVALLLAGSFAGQPTAARADEARPGAAEQTDGADDEREPRALPAPGWSYLYDGGAIPLVYGSAALALSIDLWVEPRSTPLWFDPNEGGAEYRGDTVPGWTLPVGAGAIALSLALDHDDSHWYHLKGFLESALTVLAVTRTTKVAFGRHRPDYDLTGDNPASARRSFFSGHASDTLTYTTYLGLYLRYHTFSRLRGGRWLPWWEGLTYAGLAGVAFYVPASRVWDHRHHLSDVLVGAGVGAGASAVLFWWQERRYRRARSALRRGERAAPGLIVLPDVEHPGLTLLLPF